MSKLQEWYPLLTTCTTKRSTLEEADTSIHGAGLRAAKHEQLAKLHVGAVQKLFNILCSSIQSAALASACGKQAQASEVPATSGCMSSSGAGEITKSVRALFGVTDDVDGVGDHRRAVHVHVPLPRRVGGIIDVENARPEVRVTASARHSQVRRRKTQSRRSGPP